MKWNDQELQILRENYPHTSKSQLCTILPNRQWTSIAKMAQVSGIRRSCICIQWNDSEDAVIKNLYFDGSKDEILSLLPNRTWIAITHRANSLGLKRDFAKYRRNKTYEEIFGKEKAELYKNRVSEQFRGNKFAKALKGRTYEKIYTYEKAQELKKNRGAYLKGKSYEMVFGEEKSQILKIRLSQLYKGTKNPEHSKWMKGKPSPIKGLSVIEIYGETRAISIRKKWFESNHARPNGLEKYFHGFFKEKIEYVGDGKLFIGGKCPDFKVHNQDKLIEIFGDYWHQEKELNKRIQLFETYGYKCIVLWEHEIRNDLESIKKKVENFIEKTLEIS